MWITKWVQKLINGKVFDEITLSYSLEDIKCDKWDNVYGQ